MLCDGVAHAVYERDEEGEVDGAGDARAVLQVERCEVVDDGFCGGGAEALAEKRFGQDGHGWRYRGGGIRGGFG